MWRISQREQKIFDLSQISKWRRVIASPLSQLVLFVLHEAPGEGEGHEEQDGGEDGIDQVSGKDAEERFAYGEEGEGNATDADEGTTDADPLETLGGSSSLRQIGGEEGAEEDDQTRNTVEERNCDFSQEFQVCKGGDGYGEETNGCEPLEVFLPGGEVLLGDAHGDAQRDEAGNSENKGGTKNVVAEEDEQ